MSTNILGSGIPNVANDPVASAFDATGLVSPQSASGAVAVAAGFYPITDASAAALTLAAPTAGLPSAGGNDGNVMLFVDTQGADHTITTPSNKIAPSHHVATFGGTAGAYVALKAYNGIWYVVGSSGVTMS